MHSSPARSAGRSDDAAWFPFLYSLVLALLLSLIAVGCSDEGQRNLDGVDAGSSPAGPRDECGNGFDDDADGVIDDGCFCVRSEEQSCYSGPRASRGVGVCSDGVQGCLTPGSDEFGTWGFCIGDVTPAPEERCDGQDLDCDGAVDEGCTCVTGQTRDCTMPFLEGPCQGGVQTCRLNGTWSACEGAVLPEAEVCFDLVDNDCDGSTDELCGCVPTWETCNNGLDDDCDGEVDEPECASCDPGPEVCNGIDDDCDGDVDETGCGDVCPCRNPEVGAPLELSTDVASLPTAGLAFDAEGRRYGLLDGSNVIDGPIGLLRYDAAGAGAGESLPVVADGRVGSLVALGDRWIVLYRADPESGSRRGSDAVKAVAFDDSGPVAGPVRIDEGAIDDGVEVDVPVGSPIGFADDDGVLHVVWSQCRPEAVAPTGACEGGADLYYRRFDPGLRALGAVVQLTDDFERSHETYDYASTSIAVLHGRDGQTTVGVAQLGYRGFFFDSSGAGPYATEVFFAAVRDDAVLRTQRLVVMANQHRPARIGVAASTTRFLICHQRSGDASPVAPSCVMADSEGWLRGNENAIGRPSSWGLVVGHNGCDFMVGNPVPAATSPAGAIQMMEHWQTYWSFGEGEVMQLEVDRLQPLGFVGDVRVIRGNLGEMVYVEGGTDPRLVHVACAE